MFNFKKDTWLFQWNYHFLYFCGHLKKLCTIVWHMQCIAMSMSMYIHARCTHYTKHKARVAIFTHVYLQKISWFKKKRFHARYLFVCYLCQTYPALSACIPALFAAAVGRLERVPDSQDECSAPLVCKVIRQIFGIEIFNRGDDFISNNFVWQVIWKANGNFPCKVLITQYHYLVTLQDSNYIKMLKLK